VRVWGKIVFKRGKLLDRMGVLRRPGRTTKRLSEEHGGLKSLQQGSKGQGREKKGKRGN